MASPLPRLNNRFSIRFLKAAAAASILSAASFGSASAGTGCTLTGNVSDWVHGASGNWYDSGDWSKGAPHSHKKSACITDGVSTVTLNRSAALKNLQLGVGNSLAIGDGSLSTTLSVFGSEIVNAGRILLEAASKSANLTLHNDVTLSGGGSIDLSMTGAGGKADIRSNGTPYVLDNVDNAIEGAGVIGGAGLTFINESAGTVDANTAGQTLLLAGMDWARNLGLFAASQGGTLSLATSIGNTGVIDAMARGTILINGVIANTQGLIEADAGTVQVGKGGQIDGGILNSVNGGVLQTSGGQRATLENVTLESGSTYRTTAGSRGNTITQLSGPIDNMGTFQFTGGRTYDAQLVLIGNVTLDGSGTIELGSTGAGSANILGLGLPYTLTNDNNLIEGSGSVAGLDSFVNAGTVDANLSHKTLTIATAHLTNSGHLEASDVGTLLIANIFANTGQMLATTGGTIIVRQAFSNHRRVEVDKGSTFSAALGYTNTGLTRVDGALNAPTVTNNPAGTIEGNGTIVGNLMNYGKISPGDSLGILKVNGSYTQLDTGTLAIGLGGTGAGQYGRLDVTGTSNVSGMLAVSLANGFNLAFGDRFDVLNSRSIGGDFSSLSFDNVACQSGGSGVWGCSNLGGGFYFTEELLKGQIWLTVTGPSGQGGGPVPEPASLGLLATGLLAGFGIIRRRRNVRA